METIKLQSFKDLKVWQKAAELATLVYRITEKFPHSELYGLTNQMRRAVISISSNIAEGFKRNHKKEKLQFYNVAYGSITELESQIEISYKLNYLSEKDYQELMSSTVEISKMIDGLIKSVRKPFNPKFSFLFLFIFLYSIFYLLIPSSGEAAILYLGPEQNQYYREDVFIVEIKLNTEGQDVNTVKIDLTFPQDVLEVEDFSKGDSILILWAEGPNYSNQTGTVYFTGGIPGGYLGEDGLLGKIIFKAKAKGEAKVQIEENSQVLLNDGLGTPAKLTTQGGVFTILPEKLEVSEDEWKKELEKDNIPPEIFEIEIVQAPTIFEGKYFLVFSTTDKQTGIDYYEIKEGKREWKRGKSPYLLEDQNMQNKIFVKAVDKARNERISEILPSKKLSPYLIILIIVSLLILSWLIYQLIKRFKTKIL